jgi:hypothetical protein
MESSLPLIKVHIGIYIFDGPLLKLANFYRNTMTFGFREAVLHLLMIFYLSTQIKQPYLIGQS